MNATLLPLPDRTRYAASLRRDRDVDGSFVYAVRTTGVFCRPACPARAPRPENVRFFATARDAISAGFRPCKRCRPDEPPLAQQHAARIAQACRLIEQADETPVSYTHLTLPTNREV